MNYQAIYNRIIDRARERKLENYKEVHHIIPKCMGGTNVKTNLVDLTAKEHFLCHLLLSEIHPENTKLKYALWAMVNQKNKKQKRNYRISSRLYERLKIEAAKLNTLVNTGRKLKEETKLKMSTTRTGLRKGRYKEKELKFEHVCETCNQTFKSADSKGRFCRECKKPRSCKCGCGKEVKTPGKEYASGCRTRGKSYLEIYGVSNPTCGFKKENYFGKLK